MALFLSIPTNEKHMKKFLIFLILFSFSSVALAVDDHTHFDTEKVKPGVRFVRSYRVQSEIDEDWYCSDWAIIPGDPEAGYYDSVKDGAKLQWHYDLPLPELRNCSRDAYGEQSYTCQRGTNDVWVQWEMQLSQAYLDAVITGDDGLPWDNCKLFRIMADNGVTVDDRFLTAHWEQNALVSDALEWAGSYSNIGDNNTTFSFPGDTWVRYTVHIDLDGDHLEAWCMPLGGNIIKTLDVNPSFTGSEEVFGAWPLLHSSMKVHHPTTTPHYFEFWYRNVIVSNDPIAFTTDIGGGEDTNPPGVIIGNPDPENITSDSLAIYGAASDNVGVTECKWRIGSAPNATNGTLLSGTTSWSGTASGFALGGNYLYVGCSDAAGNWGSESITVNYSISGGEQQYYVDADAPDGGDGSLSTPWNEVADVNNASISSGSTVYFQRGDSWNETLVCDNPGTVGNEVTYTAYGTGDDPILYDLTVSADYINVNNITIDHQKADNTCVSINGDYITLSDMEIKNGLRDGIDITGNHITIQNCNIHHFLKGYYGADPVQDAHLIAIHDANDVLITGCTGYAFSGDAIQADPQYNETNNIIVTGCTFYSAALTEDFNGTCPGGPGWCTGDKGGENFIDTKADSDIQTTWTIVDNTFYGLDDIAVLPNNRAALNLKHNILATVNRNEIYNCEIGIRTRGDADPVKGNPTNTIKNNVFHDNGIDLWVGDGDGLTSTTYDEVSNLKVYNNTFGDSTSFYLEDDQTLFTNWDLRNNAFLGTKPARFSHSTNISASSGDFTDSANDDYTLSASSSLKEVGDLISEVTLDFSGAARTVPYDVGAYESIATVVTSEIRNFGTGSNILRFDPSAGSQLVFRSENSATDYTQHANCVGAWYMNGSTTETDRSGGGYDLIVDGTPMPTSSIVPPGFSGTSREFTLADESLLYIPDAECGDLDINGLDAQMTICAWFRLKTTVPTNDFYYIAAKHGDSGYRQYGIYAYDENDIDRVKFWVSNNGSNVNLITSTTQLSTETWYHACGVYDGSTIQVWINGTKENELSYSGGIADETNPFHIGGRFDNDTLANTDAHMDGYIDEVIVFNTALGSVEINELMDNGISGNKGGSD